MSEGGAGRWRDLWRGRSRAPKPDSGTVHQVKAWAVAALSLDKDAALTVNEIACNDPSCPGLETIILVMIPGCRSRAYKLAKAMDEVTEQDIRDALVG